MALTEKIEAYSVVVGQNDYLPFGRSIRLRLETGSTAFLGFPPVRPTQWLSFAVGFTNAFLPVTDYEPIYHLLQTEDPVFFTAVNLFGLQVANVHTELDLALGEPTGEGYDEQSLEALIVRAGREPEDATA